MLPVANKPSGWNSVSENRDVIYRNAKRVHNSSKLTLFTCYYL